MTPDHPQADTASRVVCAANRNRDTGMIICGARHFDRIMHSQMELRPASERDGWRLAEQGFINQFGDFLTRKQAWDIAEKNGQIIRDLGTGKGVLYSEHLY